MSPVADNISESANGVEFGKYHQLADVKLKAIAEDGSVLGSALYRYADVPLDTFGNRDSDNIISAYAVSTFVWVGNPEGDYETCTVLGDENILGWASDYEDDYDDFWTGHFPAGFYSELDGDTLKTFAVTEYQPRRGDGDLASPVKLRVFDIAKPTKIVRETDAQVKRRPVSAVPFISLPTANGSHLLRGDSQTRDSKIVSASGDPIEVDLPSTLLTDLTSANFGNPLLPEMLFSLPGPTATASWGMGGTAGIRFKDPSQPTKTLKTDSELPLYGIDSSGNAIGTGLNATKVWRNTVWTDLTDLLPSGTTLPAGTATRKITPSGLIHFGTGPETDAAINWLLIPVEVVELSPKTKDEDGNVITGSDKPNIGKPLTPFVEVEPATNKIAHRELKVKIGEVLKGKTVTWTMEPLFRRTPGPFPFEFRGSWMKAAAGHQNRFEASTAYGTNGFTSLSQESGKTTVDDDGFTAIRVNVPPVGLNAARIKIQVEGIPSMIDLIDMEVPGVVVIDPGHGGTANLTGSSWNNATSPSGVLEKAMALDYGLALRDSLRAIRDTDRLNLRIFMTRETDINETGAFRAAKARDNGADVINIIHFNASDAHTARGTLEVYRTTSNVFPQQDTILSEGIITRMVTAMTLFDAGANHRSRVVYESAVASDGNNGNTAAYCPVRTAYIEVEFIDFGAQTTNRDNDAVDILLNTGPNAAAVKASVAHAMKDGILHDLRNHQPQP